MLDSRSESLKRFVQQSLWGGQKRMRLLLCQPHIQRCHCRQIGRSCRDTHGYFTGPDPAGNSRFGGIVATRRGGNDVEFQLNALAATAASAAGAAFAGGLFLFTSAIAGRGKGT